MDRNDRIVITAGIIILIIALIGIVYHEKTYVSTPKIEKNSYRIEWEEYSDEISYDGYVDKNGWKNNYTIDAGENSAICCVEAKVDWKDNLDFHGIIFPWNWTDKMEMDFSIDEFSFSQSENGYGMLSIKATIERPKDLIVKAENKSEAMKMIGNINSKIHCTISLNIQPKPRFFDRGNDFTLYITYHYYKPIIKKIS